MSAVFHRSASAPKDPSGPEDRLPVARLREIFSYDLQSGHLFWRKKPRGPTRPNWQAGTPGERGYVFVRVEGRKHAVHRIVWALATGAYPTGTVDHRNGNKSDNRLQNLREASVSENNKNVPRRGHNTSGFKGVQRNTGASTFAAVINADKKRHTIGSFKTAEEAARAYDRAALSLHGDFARLNFPEVA